MALLRRRPRPRRLSFLANALLALVTSVIVARLYGVSAIGEFALAGAPAGAVWLLSTVREQPALMRRLTPLAPRDPLVTGLFAAVLSFLHRAHRGRLAAGRPGHVAVSSRGPSITQS